MVIQVISQPVPAATTEDASKRIRTGHLVQIPLPIDSTVASRVKRALMRLADRTDAVVRPEDRLRVVLEFDTDRGKTGSGSEFEACITLARLLTSSDLNRLNTIAYIPKSRQPGVESELKGHAVLVAICANQIAMDRETRIGNAAADEKTVDPLILNFYQGIASKRLLFPVPIIQSMIDPRMELYRVRTSDGVVFADGDELSKLEASGDAIETKTLSQRGQPTVLFAEMLFEQRLIQFLTDSRTDLGRQLELEPGSLEGDPTEGRQWNAVQVNLPPYLDDRTATWTIRSIKQQLATGDVNLIILDMDEVAGDLDASLRLANHFSRYDSNRIRTVAYLKGKTTGPAAVLALSVDHLLMQDDATLGGHDQRNADEPESERNWNDVKPEVQRIADAKQRDWSILMAMLDPALSVGRYRNRDSGQIRLLSNEEWGESTDPDRWLELSQIDTTSGIDAEAATQMYLARAIVTDADQLKTFYQLKSDVRTLEKSSTDVWIEKVAATLSSPLVAPWLLFGAMFFFSSEMSAPGLGVPGFLAAICVMLFFWSQYLDGNADAVEILLFVVGLIFVLLEIFVVPGFGVFGIGGMLMLVTSVVLASQKFLLPRSAEEIAQIPWSLAPVLAAGLGFFAALFALRKVIPNSPWLSRLILDSRRSKSPSFEEESDPEAVVDWSFLIDREGETVTRLNPAGKARIDGQVYDVISRGQMIDPGERIMVVEAVANRVVVTPKQ
jgi:membrane-bound ClpP family serine protease